MSNFSIEDDMLVRYAKRYTGKGGVEYIGKTAVITKEEFIACYDAWINENKKAEERPQGKWIKIFENPYTNGYVCPFCGHKIQVTEQFLPKVTECESCGADMRGEKDETDD